MNINDNITELTDQIEQLLSKLRPLEKDDVKSTRLVSGHVRKQLSRLHKAAANNDRNDAINVLLDIVPNGKDFDSVDFRIDYYPKIDALCNDIAAKAAQIAKNLIDEL